MNRRSFLAALVALPFAPALVKLVPKPVRRITCLEQAMIDAAALAARDHGRPDVYYVNQESWNLLNHLASHEHYFRAYERDRCPECVQFTTRGLKARLLAKYKPAPFPNLDGGYNGIWG